MFMNQIERCGTSRHGDAKPFQRFMEIIGAAAMISSATQIAR